MVAEFESDLIRLRTREGMKVAKAKGRLRGKQPKLNRKQEAHLVSLVHSGEYSTLEVAEVFGVGRSTVYRANRPPTRRGQGRHRGSDGRALRSFHGAGRPASDTPTGRRRLQPAGAPATSGGGSACGTAMDTSVGRTTAQRGKVIRGGKTRFRPCSDGERMVRLVPGVGSGCWMLGDLKRRVESTFTVEFVSNRHDREYLGRVDETRRPARLQSLRDPLCHPDGGGAGPGARRCPESSVNRHGRGVEG